MHTQILVDSACDLPEAYHKSYNTKMVPLSVELDNATYEDGVEIAPKEVYQAMRNGKKPTTSQVAPETFQSIFKEYAARDEALVYVAFSSELSGTYQTAKMMEQETKKEYPEAPIHVLDTKCASIGYGLVALFAAELASENKSPEEIVARTSDYAANMEHIFTVDDLEYLHRGGRVSKTAAFVGSLLKIKPILHVEAGKLIPLEKIRGSRKVLRRMMEIMDERGENLNGKTIGISHGDDIENAEKLAEMIREKYEPEAIIIEMVGAVIGAHSGPGTIALFFPNKAYKD